LVAKLPRHPLRRRPHGDKHDREDNDDLTPKDLGRGHTSDQEMTPAKDKSGTAQGVRSAAMAYNSDGRQISLQPTIPIRVYAQNSNRRFHPAPIRR
jgi:hypothetical protein